MQISVGEKIKKKLNKCSQYQVAVNEPSFSVKRTEFWFATEKKNHFHSFICNWLCRWRMASWTTKGKEARKKNEKKREEGASMKFIVWSRTNFILSTFYSWRPRAAIYISIYIFAANQLPALFSSRFSSHTALVEININIKIIKIGKVWRFNFWFSEYINISVWAEYVFNICIGWFGMDGLRHIDGFGRPNDPQCQ